MFQVIFATRKRDEFVKRMQGILSCPFYNTSKKGVGRHLLEKLQEKARQEAFTIRVCPHLQNSRWRDTLAKKKSFIRDMNGRLLDAESSSEEDDD